MANQISDTWERGNLYERYVGRWSRQVAPLFLSWLDRAPGLRWLDTGCGTGALLAAIVDDYSPDLVVGVEPSAGFIKVAKGNLAGRVVLTQGTAAHIPLASSSIDCLVSGLVLNFVPDPRAALTEMVRVTRPKGCIGAYLWDYAGKMEFMRYFWDVAAELNPDVARLDEGSRFPLCNPQGLRELFAGAWLNEIDVSAIDLPTRFADFDDYWQPFLGGQGPAPAYAMSLDGDSRARLRDLLQERLPAQPDGSISMIARAWAIRATVVK